MSTTGINQDRPTVTLHMVSSLDGFIARKDNSVSWLEGYADTYEAGVYEEEGAEEFVKSIDCYVLGSRTYEHALELGWPYGETPVVVITSRELTSTRKNVEFYSGDLKTLVEAVLAPRFGNIWLVGGARVCESFLQLDLVDEIKVTVAPVLLGGGLRMFGDSGVGRKWQLKGSVAYKNGFVAVRYGRVAA